MPGLVLGEIQYTTQLMKYLYSQLIHTSCKTHVTSVSSYYLLVIVNIIHDVHIRAYVEWPNIQ